MRILAGIAATALAIVLAGLFARTVEPPPELAVRADEPPVARPTRFSRAGVRLQRVDPVTLADRTDLPALRVATDGWPVASPDGRLIAVVPEGIGPITVVDVERWQPVTVLEATPPVWLVAFDGDALLWIEGGALLVHQRLDGTRREIALPSIEDWWDVRPLGDGRVALFSIDDTGPAHVVVVDLDAVRVVTDLAVDGIVFGDGEGPGTAWDVARRRLYITSGDQLTVVDLAAGAVAARADLPPEPEGTEGVVRSAAVSQDGSRLIVTGQRWRGPTDEWTSLPTRVLDLATLTEVERFDGSAGYPLFTPDGRFLLLAGDSLTVLDATTRRTVLHIDGVYLAGASLDGRHVYLTDATSSTLRALDLSMQVVTGERDLHGNEWLLGEAGVLVS